MKFYLVAEEGEEISTWGPVYKKYEAYCGKNRAIAQKTFMEYQKARFIQYSLQRKEEDVCDTCVRIQVALADETLDPVARKALEDSKRVHVTEARAQRIGLKEAIKQWGAKHLSKEDAEMFNFQVDGRLL